MESLKVIKNCVIDEDNIEFKNVRYEGCLFKDIDLNSSIFDNAHFYSCGFSNAFMFGCFFANSTFDACNINDSVFSNAVFLDCEMARTTARKTNFFNAAFSNVQSVDSYLIYCNMNSTKFDNVTTNKPMLIGCPDKLSDVVFDSKQFILSGCGGGGGGGRRGGGCTGPCGWYPRDGDLDPILKPYQTSAPYTVDLRKLELNQDKAKTVVYGKDFSKKDISKLDMDNKSFIRCKFNDAVSFNKTINNSNFLNCELNGINLAGAVLNGCQFDECIMPNSNFYGVLFSGTIIAHSNLDASNFSSSKHYDSVFYGDSMRESSFSFIREGKMTVLDSDIIDTRTTHIAPESIVLDERTYFTNINQDHTISQIDKVSKKFDSLETKDFIAKVDSIKQKAYGKVL